MRPGRVTVTADQADGCPKRICLCLREGPLRRGGAGIGAQVGKQPGDLQAGQRKNLPDGVVIACVQAEAVHPGIQRQVALDGAAGGESFGVVQVQNRLGQIILQELRELGGVRVAQDQDLAADPAPAQGHGFVQTGDTEGVDAVFL